MSTLTAAERAQVRRHYRHVNAPQAAGVAQLLQALQLSCDASDVTRALADSALMQQLGRDELPSLDACLEVVSHLKELHEARNDDVDATVREVTEALAAVPPTTAEPLQAPAVADGDGVPSRRGSFGGAASRSFRQRRFSRSDCMPPTAAAGVLGVLRGQFGLDVDPAARRRARALHRARAAGRPVGSSAVADEEGRNTNDTVAQSPTVALSFAPDPDEGSSADDEELVTAVLVEDDDDDAAAESESSGSDADGSPERLAAASSPSRRATRRGTGPLGATRRGTCTDLQGEASAAFGSTSAAQLSLSSPHHNAADASMVASPMSASSASPKARRLAMLNAAARTHAQLGQLRRERASVAGAGEEGDVEAESLGLSGSDKMARLLAQANRMGLLSKPPAPTTLRARRQTDAASSRFLTVTLRSDSFTSCTSASTASTPSLQQAVPDRFGTVEDRAAAIYQEKLREQHRQQRLRECERKPARRTATPDPNAGRFDRSVDGRAGYGWFAPTGSEGQHVSSVAQHPEFYAQHGNDNIYARHFASRPQSREAGRPAAAVGEGPMQRALGALYARSAEASSGGALRLPSSIIASTTPKDDATTAQQLLAAKEAKRTAKSRRRDERRVARALRNLDAVQRTDCLLAARAATTTIPPTVARVAASPLASAVRQSANRSTRMVQRCIEGTSHARWVSTPPPSRGI